MVVSKVYSNACQLILTGLAFFALSACQNSQSTSTNELPSGVHVERLKDGMSKVWMEGETMGTAYHVTYLDAGGKIWKAAIDSLLADFNNCLSTYDQQSAISRWNQSDLAVFNGSCGDWTREMLQSSLEFYLLSKGAFDPTVMPLVRYWGFFKEDPFSGQLQIDSERIAGLTQLVGLDRVVTWNDSIDQHSRSKILVVSKLDTAVELDFSAIAKGYGVDLVAGLLHQKGLRNYLVEIGGEVVAAGHNDRKEPWSLAIEKPVEGEREAQAVIGLSNAGLATSGNYRKFWERDGQKYGHTLNPQTGFPEISNLLSATILAPSCAEADALATTCMVLGVDRSLKLLEELEGREGYLLFLDQKGLLTAVQTSGFSEATKLPNSR